MAYYRLTALAGAAMLCAAQPACATLITFDDLAAGTKLSTQYASLGVTFAANALKTADAATNTDMTIVSSTGSDTGILGAGSLVSGNILHSFTGWTDENGDPSFAITFTSTIASLSIAFAGIDDPASTQLLIYNGSTLLSTITATGTGQQTLSYSGAVFTKAIVVPGSYQDWVGVDNVNFTTAAAVSRVPEPGSWALFVGGFGLAGAALRRRKAPVRFA